MQKNVNIKNFIMYIKEVKISNAEIVHIIDESVFAITRIIFSAVYLCIRNDLQLIEVIITEEADT